MYKEDLELSNLQWLKCQKNPTKANQTKFYGHILAINSDSIYQVF